MFVKQVSVFLENKLGRLATVTKILGDNGIDISAMALADTTNFGILRMIVNDPDKAVSVLKEAGFTVSTTDVLAVEVDDRPGGLAAVLEVLQDNGISIEYAYSFIKRAGDKAFILFRVENPDRAVELLKNTGVRVLDEKEVYAL
ncbi:ACT domain-containing protein [Mahella australiensis]|uniref:ACT domain protein n=1 Tax=Mahella australiensis (strain DSM 15567 / CIP 107919 / 50-1 BON) TaxID=697281 RepID=F4A307_MAHA5|nr:ACT domain-containing protein [Mahella australiensis]AEE97350.1 ACT domain protein [Mahella australiensis 50-1 BON]